MPQLTREEAEQMMRDNLERINALIEAKFEELTQNHAIRDYQDFIAFRENYKVYNATNIPVLPRGSMVLIDTRPAVGTSGIVAKYSSLGDKYVEEWAKQVNP